jgi:PAS domain S-box-containing protein
VRADPDFAPWREEALRRGYAACIALPLSADGVAIGALTVCASTPDAFDEQEVAVLMDLANDLAYGVVSLRARAERVRAEAELQAVIDNTTAVVYAKDVHGKYILINRRYEEIFHVRKAEIIGNTDYDYFPAPMADAFRTNDLCVVETGAPIEVEEVVQQKDGPHVYISCKFPLRTREGAVYAVCGISTDITERTRIEQERVRLVEELRAAVSARNEFLAVAAHELRTPLTPLVLHVQHFKKLLARGDLSSLSPVAVERVAETIAQQVARLVKLVEHLLDASWLASGKLSLELADTDLREVVREALDRYRAEIASSGSSIELDLPEAIVGQWDRLRLVQVVTNLLTNALKYGLKRPIFIAARRVDGRAVLTVTDHGMGIRKEEQGRIFEPFIRAVAYTSISGFGMGLYVVRQIVDAHGATIRVDSEPGRGSTITIELPLSGPRELDHADE